MKMNKEMRGKVICVKRLLSKTSKEALYTEKLTYFTKLLHKFNKNLHTFPFRAEKVSLWIAEN